MGAPGDQPFPWLGVGIVAFFVLMFSFAAVLGVMYCSPFA